MRRGDVFALRLPRGMGHVQQGRRFGVVVQSDALLPRSVVLVAPTSRSAKPASFRPEIEIDGAPTRVLVEQVEGAGEHSVGWDGRDDSGMEMSAGIYFYRLETEQLQTMKKMVLVK